MAAAAKTHIAEKGGNPKIVTVTAFGVQDRTRLRSGQEAGAPRLIVPPMRAWARPWVLHRAQGL